MHQPKYDKFQLIVIAILPGAAQADQHLGPVLLIPDGLGGGQGLEQQVLRQVWHQADPGLGLGLLIPHVFGGGQGLLAGLALQRLRQAGRQADQGPGPVAFIPEVFGGGQGLGQQVPRQVRPQTDQHLGPVRLIHDDFGGGQGLLAGLALQRLRQVGRQADRRLRTPTGLTH